MSDDDYRNRLGMRFEDDPEDDTTDQNEPDEADEPDETESEPESEPEQDTESKPDPTAELDLEPKAPEIAPGVSNIRDAWDGFGVYLPPTMHKRVEKEYQRLVYETEWDLKKGRHYYPLIFYYGLNTIANVDGEDVKALIENMEA